MTSITSVHKTNYQSTTLAVLGQGGEAIMNCKPNQLAYLAGNVMVRDSNSAEWVVAISAGRIVKTVTLEPSGIAWVIEEPIDVDMVLPTGYRVNGRLISIRDDLLKPILPPDNELTELMEEIRKEMSEVSHELV